MKNKICMKYLMHKGIGLGPLSDMGVAQEQASYDTLMRSPNLPDNVKEAIPKPMSKTYTSKVTGNTYSYSATQPYHAVTTIAKGELASIIKKVLNESAKNSAKKKNAPITFNDGDPLHSIALRAINDAQKDKQYMHDYYEQHKPEWLEPGGKYYHYEPKK